MSTLEGERIEQRKITPVAAMISAGKSKLLNVLFNINYLECRAGIGTKFVNLLRYNPDIKEPIFYHLKVKKEGKEYIFYKDLSKKYQGEKEIIEANKAINEELYNNKNLIYEDLFYMTEINSIPFITDKDFLLSHDLCDIPGLSEYQENTKENACDEQKEAETEDFSRSNTMDKITMQGKDLGLSYDITKDFLTQKLDLEGIDEKDIKEDDNDNAKENVKEENKDEDEIYYKISDNENQNTYLTEIYKIIKDYIEGGIIIMSVENYYFEENFELIAKLNKVINKDIVKFLVILNKMDLSSNPKADIEKFKGLIIKHFPKCRTFNINLNTFIPLSVNQLQNELLMKTSFKHLIRYHFYNYVSNIKKEKLISKNVDKTFIEHLKEIIKTDKSLDKKAIETKVEQVNKMSNLDEIKKEIISIINDLTEEFKGNSDIKLGISSEDVDEDEDEEFNDDDDDLKPVDVIKAFYLFHKNNILMPLFSEETVNLLEYFKNDHFSTNIIREIKNEEQNENSINRQIMKCLKHLNKKLKKAKIEVEKIKSLIYEIRQTSEFLKIYDSILIPFLGASNAGKTTIINGMLGDDILPTDLNECTKRGIIIRYHEDEMTIRKANFKKEKLLNRAYYYFEAEKNIIGKGKKQVTEILKGLNYDFSEKEEDSFYYLQTKIKLFDELGFDSTLKKKIYLIDFPGFGTKNKFETEIYKKVMSICNSFFFTIKNSVIKENNNQIVLNSLFNEAKEQKQILPSLFIKSCLFILNNDRSQSSDKKDVDKAKEDINYLIKGINKDNINLCFYNAKYYSNYNDNKNYFFNIKQTFEFEYQNYLSFKRNIFKSPEKVRGKNYKTFIEYMFKKLSEKIKNEGLGTVKKNQVIDNNIKGKISRVLTDFLNRKIIEMSDILKYEENFAKIFTLGQEKIEQLKVLKESNYEEFKKAFNSQIKYINDFVKKNVGQNIDKVLNTLDIFFSTDFSEKKTNITEINNFTNYMKIEKRKINESYAKNQTSLFQVITEYRDSIIKTLTDKEENIKQLLKSKNIKEIFDEIINEIKNNIKNLNEKLIEIVWAIDSDLRLISEDFQEILKKFSEGKTSFDKIDSFTIYFSLRVGDKTGNLEEEILQELTNSCQNLSIIYEKKGFKDWLYSAFSNEHYLKNIIELLVNSFIKKMEYILVLISEQLKLYSEDLFHSIEKSHSLATTTFTEEQLSYWKEIKNYYEANKDKITSLKNLLKK